MGMIREAERDPLRRYDQLWAAEYRGERMKIVSAVNVLQAAEKAAKHYGVSPEEFRENGIIREPKAEEAEKFCRESGSTMRMTVSTKYGAVKVDAICREDAIRQAAAKLGRSYQSINTIATIVKTERKKEEEISHGYTISFTIPITESIMILRGKMF